MAVDTIGVGLAVEGDTLLPALDEATRKLSELRQQLTGASDASDEFAGSAEEASEATKAAGDEAKESATKVEILKDSWQSTVSAVKDMVEIGEKLFRAISSGFKMTVGAALEMRGETDALVQAWRETEQVGKGVAATIGEIVLQAVPVEQVTGIFGELQEQFADADSALGSFVRTSLSLFAQGAALATEAVVGLTSEMMRLRTAAETGLGSALDSLHTAWLDAFGTEEEQQAWADVVEASDRAATVAVQHTEEQIAQLGELSRRAREIADAVSASVGGDVEGPQTGTLYDFTGEGEGMTFTPDDMRGGGGGRSRQQEEARVAQQLGQQLAQSSQRQAGVVVNAYKRQKEALEEWVEAQITAKDRQLALEQELFDARAAKAKELSELDAQRAAAAEASAIAERESLISNVGAVASGVAGLLGSRREVELVDGLVEEARAISSLAMFDFWGAATHQLAALAHFKAATAAGGSGGGGGGSASAGGGGLVTKPASPMLRREAAAPQRSTVENDQSRAGITQNFYGLHGREEVGAAALSALNAHARYNSGTRLDRRLLGGGR